MIKKHKVYIFLAMTFVLTQFTTGLYVAVMPAMSTFYHVSHKEIMFSMSLFLVGFAIGQLFWGALSDVFSRKKLYIIAFLLYLLESGTFCFHIGFSFYLVLFFIWGFCTAAFTSIGNAIVKDVYGAEKAAAVIGGIGIAMATGPIIGPFIGAHLFSLFNDVKIIFIVLVLYALVALVGIKSTLVLPEKQAHSSQQHMSFFAAFKSLMLNRWYVFYVVSVFLVYGAFFGYVTVSAFLFLKQYALSGSRYADFYLLSGISCIAGAIINRYFIPILGVKRLVVAGTLIALLGAVILFVAQQLAPHVIFWTLLSISVAMFGIGFVVPSCKAGAMISHPTHAGMASSILQFLQIMGGVVFTFILSQVSVSFLNISILIGGSATISLMLVTFLALKESSYADKNRSA